MQIVIAGKNPNYLNEYLIESGYKVKVFYVNDLCLDVAQAFNPEVFIYIEDVVDRIPHEQALKQLKDYRVIIIASKDNSVIPYAAALGIKDFVFQPCEMSAILNRIENPATAEEAAELLRYVPKLTTLPETLAPHKKINISNHSWFCCGKNAGAIVAGKYIQGKWSNPLAIVEDNLSCDAVVIPASWGIKAIRDYHRDFRTKTIPLVVIKGNQEHLSAGADRCVKKITPELIQDVIAMSVRFKKLWQSIESDPLTGLYTRRFLNCWIEEQKHNGRKYTAVMIDLDKFKNINDSYGHSAGDAVLAAFGDFLKTESRVLDFIARYGGEEFFIGLPNTTALQAKYLVDRIREKWAERFIVLPDGKSIKTTFSAGVAEWYQGCSIIEEADKMLYNAKESGRNQVQAVIKQKILILGKININKNKTDITYDPSEATAVISDIMSFRYAPETLPLYVIGTGSISDWAVKRDRPNAVICFSVEDAISKLDLPRTNLTVLPGTRSSGSHQTIPEKGALYIVCPSRPSAAGEIAAKICHDVHCTALICAAPESTAALHMGIAKEKLITSDWRIPGADAPLQWTEVMVWPVDPYKFINANVNVHRLVDQIKNRFSLTIIDCGGSLDLCCRPTKDEGILILSKEGDVSDQITQHWLETYRGNNVFLLAPSETPEIIVAENGFLLGRNSISIMQQ